MTAKETRITAFIHSPAMAHLLLLAACVGAYMAWCTGRVAALTPDKGLGLPSANLWFTSPGTNCLIGMASILGLAGLMILINSRFNILRDITRIYAGVFAVMMCATPVAFDTFTGGTLLAIVVCGALLPLYTIYNKPAYTRMVFLSFFMLAAGALSQYAFIAYIPIFLMGLGQMRVFGGRPLMAALLGVITPWWICWAFGFISFDPFHTPDFDSILSTLSPAGRLQFMVTVGATVVIALTLSIINLIKVFSYNSRSRSYNGFLTLLLLSTCVLIPVDYTNIPCYLTLLNLLTAFQVGQFFVIRLKQRSSYITVISVIVIYTALWAWWMAI